MKSDHLTNGQSSVHPLILPRLMPHIPIGSTAIQQYNFPLIPSSCTSHPGFQIPNSYSAPVSFLMSDQTDVKQESISSDESMTVELENEELWKRFDEIGTEMIVTKPGRRMFPCIRLQCMGMDPVAKYVILVDVVPVDNCRYKYNNSEWSVTGKGEPHIHNRLYIHPDSPAPGSHWMKKAVSFHKLKITNNNMDRNGHIILNTMQKYQLRVHVVRAHDINFLNWGEFRTTTFAETKFIPVTAYQSERITQLKVDNNPFAKGFRDNRRTCFGGKRHRLHSDEIGNNFDDEPKSKRQNVEQDISKFDELCRTYVLPHSTSFSDDKRADCTASPDLSDNMNSPTDLQREVINNDLQPPVVTQAKTEIGYKSTEDQKTNYCTSDLYSVTTEDQKTNYCTSDLYSVTNGDVARTFGVSSNTKLFSEQQTQHRPGNEMQHSTNSKESSPHGNISNRLQQEHVSGSKKIDQPPLETGGPFNHLLSFYHDNFLSGYDCNNLVRSTKVEIEPTASNIHDSYCSPNKGFRYTPPFSSDSTEQSDKTLTTENKSMQTSTVFSRDYQPQQHATRVGCLSPVVPNMTSKEDGQDTETSMQHKDKPVYHIDFSTPFPRHHLDRNSGPFYPSVFSNSENRQFTPYQKSERLNENTSKDKLKSPIRIHRIENILHGEKVESNNDLTPRNSALEPQRGTINDTNSQSSTQFYSNISLPSNFYKHPVFTFGDAVIWGDQKTNV